jgi:hypothetical protein
MTGGGFVVWRQQMLDELARAKRNGVPFDAAWTAAIHKHPPRGVGVLGPAQPELGDEVSVVDFFRQACSDAWHGRREELEDLPQALAGGLTRDWPTVGGRHVGGRGGATGPG